MIPSESSFLNRGKCDSRYWDHALLPEPQLAARGSPFAGGMEGICKTRYFLFRRTLPALHKRILAATVAAYYTTRRWIPCSTSTLPSAKAAPYHCGPNTGPLQPKKAEQW